MNDEKEGITTNYIYHIYDLLILHTTDYSLHMLQIMGNVFSLDDIASAHLGIIIIIFFTCIQIKNKVIRYWQIFGINL